MGLALTHLVSESKYLAGMEMAGINPGATLRMDRMEEKEKKKYYMMMDAILSPCSTSPKGPALNSRYGNARKSIPSQV